MKATANPDGLAGLIITFLSDVTKKPAAPAAGTTSAPAPDPADDEAGDIKKLNEFFSGFEGLNEDDVVSGWKALQIVKVNAVNPAQDFKDHIDMLEENLKERMFLISDNRMKMAFRTSWREKFRRLTGDNDFFSGIRGPRITKSMNGNVSIPVASVSQPNNTNV